MSTVELTDPITPEVHQAACRYRLGRVRAALTQADCDAALLTGPINIRYATDTTNMQVWTLHNAARCALVFAAGPVVVFEFHNCAHLHAGNALVDWCSIATNVSPAAAPAQSAATAGDCARGLTHGGARGTIG